MTPHDWNAIVNPPKRYKAFFVVDGDELYEVTTADTIEGATKALQPGWRVKIEVTKLESHQ